MASDETERLLDEIGRLLGQDRDCPRHDTLLYAELDHDMIGESIFKDLDDRVLYRRPVIPDLPYALHDLWKAQTGTERWMEMEYLLRDGRFEVVYFHPDAIDPDTDLVERRARSGLRHFGPMPIIYPPWTCEPHELDYDQ
ncbi:hypothetical protein LPN01_13045 [Sphingomonas sp. A2-49]|uniref:hypothetical protein n=1 Tax=Sphingomonas sp. A2-49 TaxID=1391375 RepID=UPI0021D12C01|nr:hypothetical protein [Sphingomonas sp. A2-49]MCU6455006.1 hypothetical protein [Sphingomonas sp. A2-49]